MVKYCCRFYQKHQVIDNIRGENQKDCRDHTAVTCHHASSINNHQVLIVPTQIMSIKWRNSAAQDSGCMGKIIACSKTGVKVQRNIICLRLTASFVKGYDRLISCITTEFGYSLSLILERYEIVETTFISFGWISESKAYMSRKFCVCIYSSACIEYDWVYDRILG